MWSSELIFHISAWALVIVVWIGIAGRLLARLSLWQHAAEEKMSKLTAQEQFTEIIRRLDLIEKILRHDPSTWAFGSGAQVQAHSAIGSGQLGAIQTQDYLGKR